MKVYELIELLGRHSPNKELVVENVSFHTSEVRCKTCSISNVIAAETFSPSELYPVVLVSKVTNAKRRPWE